MFVDVWTSVGWFGFTKWVCVVPMEAETYPPTSIYDKDGREGGADWEGDGWGGGLGRPQMLFFSSGLEDSTLKQGIIKTSKVLSEGFITISCILYKSPRMI